MFKPCLKDTFFGCLGGGWGAVKILNKNHFDLFMYEKCTLFLYTLIKNIVLGYLISVEVTWTSLVKFSEENLALEIVSGLTQQLQPLLPCHQ